MAEVYITPDKIHAVPYDIEDEMPATVKEDLAISGATAELQEKLGANIDLDPEDAEEEKKLIAEAIANKKLKTPLTQNTAFAAAAFLRTYGQALALDVAAARAAITNKLMELSNCGDPRYELKALELLGKHSDISLFTNRSEVTINYSDPSELEDAIKERVKRLLNAEMVDVTPVGLNLDEELGVMKIERATPKDTTDSQQESAPTVEGVVEAGKKVSDLNPKTKVIKDFKDLPKNWGAEAKPEPEVVK